MGGGVVRLSRQIGLKKALGIILTARMVSAQEGYDAGFVNEVTSEDVLACAKKWAAEIAECGPLSLKASLQMAYANFDLPDLASALDPRSYPATMELLASDDAAEGRRAFVERRKPQWTGR
jgi:crotonobetainyl-CoA hydratase